MDEIDSDEEFKGSDSVKAYLRKYPIKFSNSVNKATNAKLRATLTEGIEAGESIDKLAKRVHSVFEEASQTRCVAIARTETSRAVNFATVEGYKQSGAVS